MRKIEDYNKNKRKLIKLNKEKILLSNYFMKRFKQKPKNEEILMDKRISDKFKYLAFRKLKNKWTFRIYFNFFLILLFLPLFFSKKL